LFLFCFKMLTSLIIVTKSLNSGMLDCKSCFIVFCSWSLKSYPRQVEKDGSLLANTTAFLLQTGVKLSDIVIASYHNEVSSDISVFFVV